MIVWTPTVFECVLYACVFYFCICTCSAQLSMFHMDKRSRNTLIIIIIMSAVLKSSLQLVSKVTIVVVCWLLNGPATCNCISGTDLLNFTCCHT